MFASVVTFLDLAGLYFLAEEEAWQYSRNPTRPPIHSN